MQRNVPIEMSPEEFRKTGYAVVDEIASFLESLNKKPVTSGLTQKEIRSVIGDKSLPSHGQHAGVLIAEAAKLLKEHSLFNGHPRFWGYITSSAAPLGALADMLAAAINPNVGAFILSPVATEIERQAIQWIAELIGYPVNCGGLFVSGGNVANFVGLLAARKNRIPTDISKEGFDKIPSTIYCAEGTHTWIQKGADIFGFGTDYIRWIPVNDQQQMKIGALQSQIDADRRAGYRPFLIVGTAGSVGTGAVDPLDKLAEISEAEKCWFHVDGAYGAPAASLDENKDLFAGLERADSIALDPHKWLYNPLEAGCILVRDHKMLHDTFHYHPPYYRFDSTEENPVINFHEYGLQNSRGFRALKVWLGLQQAGRSGYQTMIRDDIALARHLFEVADKHQHLEAVSCHLSITTFRYVPDGIDRLENRNDYLNLLNERIVSRIQEGGEMFLSQAIVRGLFCLRVCIVNFRTTLADIEAVPGIVARYGAVEHQTLMTEKVK